MGKEEEVNKPLLKNSFNVENKLIIDDSMTNQFSKVSMDSNFRKRSLNPTTENESVGIRNFENSDEEEEFDDFNLEIEADPSYHTPTQSLIGRQMSIREKNWFARNFRPVSNGGIRSSMFTLVTGTVGAGVLSLPAISSYFGLATALTFIILFGV